MRNNVHRLKEYDRIIRFVILWLLAGNVLQAGPVCFWNTCLPNVCLKILMFVAFAKMKNLSTETFCKSYYLVCANWACLLLAVVFPFIIDIVLFNAKSLLFKMSFIEGFISISGAKPFLLLPK